VTPANFGVQIVTDITVVFKTKSTLYSPAVITMEFPISMILPPTNSAISIKPQGDTRNYFLATTGTVLSGNIVKIDKVFGGVDPPIGGLTMTVVLVGI